jgi:anaerobic selenocysteine-containing dehydrogenase
MGLLAKAMGFNDPWLQQSADEVIDEVLRTTARHNPFLEGITLERLKREGAVPLNVTVQPPFADGQFPTPSGKVELYCQALADQGLDPLPGNFNTVADDGGQTGSEAESLWLITGASHHFVSSSLASQAGLLKNAGPAFLEIHPSDAKSRGIHDGETVEVGNGRGKCRLRAVVTDAVRPGVVVSPKGRWAKHNGGTNVNWTTPDALADFNGQSTFHGNRVWVRRITEGAGHSGD